MQADVAEGPSRAVAWRSGDDAARTRQIEALYRRELAPLLRRLRYLLQNPDDAEEIAQLAFMRMVEAGAGIDDLNCEYAFLVRVARNLAIDHLRRGALSQRIFKSTDLETAERCGEFLHPFDDAESVYHDRDMLMKIDRALTALPPKCRAAFMMSRGEDKSHVEIAQAMGLSVSMVEKYMRRAMSHIRDHLVMEPLAA
jgi:RNA polymerase sigma-70 factor (ECF subfamily)